MAIETNLSAHVPSRPPNIAPLSYAQQRLWFLDQLEPGGSGYNMPTAIRLEGTLNVEALERSLAEIQRRHETLRTSFAVVDGRPVQVIGGVPERTLTRVDLTQLAPRARETEVRRRIAQDATAPFDLGQGPLLRATLLTLAAEAHVLLLTLHHIVSDGWSTGVLYDELATLYEAFAAGRPSPLAELTFQYRDFARWQRQWLAEGELEQQLAYWKRQLAELPVLDLPTDRPRLALQTARGAARGQRIPPGVTTAVSALSRTAGCTLFMTVLAAFQTLLARYTGQRDVVVGSPIANRTRAEIEPLIGFFVNTLVLRTEVRGEATFRELLGQVREMTLEAYAHQDLPFEKLVEELQPERDLSHTPLFQVMFIVQNASEQEFALPGVTATPLEVEGESALFDLTVSVEEADGGELVVLWDYNAALFDASTIARMATHFERLLDAVTTQPDRALGTLSLLTPRERTQLLETWNATATAYPQTACVHELFEAQVARTPEAVAVVCGRDQLTYGALNARANQLAHRLRALGVGPDGLVAVCLERSVDLLVAVLGVLKAGGAYVPLDPTYPRQRLAFMVADAAVPIVVTETALRPLLPETAATVLCLDAEAGALAAAPAHNPAPVATPDNLIYVIYTSGSTGRPKGSLIAHRGVAHRLFWMLDAYNFTNTDRFLQRAPFGFDVSAWELLLPLISGAQLVLALPGAHADPAYLVQAIAEHQITGICFVPSLLQMFLDQPDLDTLVSLRLVICGAEALSPDLHRRFFERIKGAELHNLYGPTEATFHVTGWPCTPRNVRHVTPIGRPMSNVEIYILDDDLQPVPVGVHGELHIGGIGLARGYLNRPDLTAEKFIPHPFSDDPAARLYKTGDRARYLRDGSIEFLGRLDAQVKIRGFRIELGEIETVLAQSPLVRECTVVVREDVPGDKRLLAYVVPTTPGEVPAAELRASLREALPDYMVPALIVALDAMPMTPNGKVDRAALPAPRRRTDDAVSPPRTRVEQILAAIWTQILDIDRPDITDNFFDLGGHSLLATQLVSRIRDAFHVELPLRAVFEAPSIAELASRIDALLTAEPIDDGV